MVVLPSMYKLIQSLTLNKLGEIAHAYNTSSQKVGQKFKVILTHIYTINCKLKESEAKSFHSMKYLYLAPTLRCSGNLLTLVPTLFIQRALSSLGYLTE